MKKFYEEWLIPICAILLLVLFVATAGKFGLLNKWKYLLERKAKDAEASRMEEASARANARAIETAKAADALKSSADHLAKDAEENKKDLQKLTAIIDAKTREANDLRIKADQHKRSAEDAKKARARIDNDINSLFGSGS